MADHTIRYYGISEAVNSYQCSCHFVAVSQEEQFGLRPPHGWFHRRWIFLT